MADQPRMLHRSADKVIEPAPNEPAHGPCIKCSFLLTDITRTTQNQDIKALHKYWTNNQHRYQTLYFVHKLGEQAKARVCYMVQEDAYTCTNLKYGHGPLNPDEPCGGDVGVDYFFERNVREELNFSLAFQHGDQFPTVPQYPWHIKYPRTIPPPENGFGVWIKDPSVDLENGFIRHDLTGGGSTQIWDPKGRLKHRHQSN